MAWSATAAGSNLAPGDVLLDAVGHFNQTPPGAFQERHHAVHVAVARQRDFDLALALGDLRLRLSERVRLRDRVLRHRFLALAGHRTLALGKLRLELFVLGLQPTD